MYSLLRKCLFALDPEYSHELSLDCLGAASRLNLLNKFVSAPANNPVELFGLSFPNPVGLAAGLDKNGDYFNALGQLGFGFVEIGTITPRPQAGNPKPRLFRLEEEKAIINRMGFNNKGVDYLVEQVKKRQYDGVLGINIGKNKDTAEEDALSDYRICLEKAYGLADYITVNISSPNTPGLRDLQFGGNLKRLLEGLKESQQQLAAQHGRKVPILVKIAPDMDDEAVVAVAATIQGAEMEGVIATNTTVTRNGVENSAFRDEAGGLSGSPLTDKSTEIIAKLYQELGDETPIVGVGGIDSAAAAIAKLEAGAKLLQIYSSFIYQGPQLIKDVADAYQSFQGRK
ncbi:quinone-dependent dihydroorotate dehydrogenase [uncultured Pseudoteredinibacter sp.]|uniref:quinone-dependent dihydroorotate dehydrogenase n=1 Tax=uncultured Pseudoteredinibacter sp. TaxID=1641701 RepID=UPI0026354F3B|nr:quinone-dependent dihydroorotate dehydrogenase [uncultured Pseudoteredinibacter sp.]